MSMSSNHLCKFQSAFTFSSISYLDVKIIVWKKPDMPETSLVMYIQVSVEVFGTTICLRGTCTTFSYSAVLHHFGSMPVQV